MLGHISGFVMTAPTSPKEALHELYDLVVQKTTGTSEDAVKAHKIIIAAIPVAELHEEIVGAVFNPSSCNTDDFWEKMHRIRHKLEALQCNPPK